ncbi:hypothetical protein [Aeromonas salmonicida]|uniref:hypothetical protein n=1 Tax=Aeromonas salmonicida TaxID=645 RepID=UPI002330841B|nr:hypothetical protein [Aeromonas salmonicida]WCH28856.1 hypothetical protein ONZ66_08680 [Aeromonas salmonicida]
MIDNSAFLEGIRHAMGNDGIEEKSSTQAYKLDSPEGVGCHLHFSNSLLSKVDYFIEKDHIVKLIELSDLEEQIRECQIKHTHIASLSARENRKLRKKAWQPLTDEFKKKWCGSIAVIERLYRKNNILDTDPRYKLIIVCRNHTDPRMLDTLEQQLRGMMGMVTVTNTKNISSHL